MGKKDQIPQYHLPMQCIYLPLKKWTWQEQYLSLPPIASSCMQHRPSPCKSDWQIDGHGALEVEAKTTFRSQVLVTWLIIELASCIYVCMVLSEGRPPLPVEHACWRILTPMIEILDREFLVVPVLASPNLYNKIHNCILSYFNKQVLLIR